jgi:hypothetical protein
MLFSMFLCLELLLLPLILFTIYLKLVDDINNLYDKMYTHLFSSVFKTFISIFTPQTKSFPTTQLMFLGSKEDPVVLFVRTLPFLTRFCARTPLAIHI